MKRILAVILLFSTLNLFGENKKTTPTPVPEPYEKEEFSPVLHDVRRATVVFAGALPLGYMYSSIACDSFIINSDYELDGSTYSDLDDSDKVAVKLVSSLSFALVVTLIDLIIEKFFRR